MKYLKKIICNYKEKCDNDNTFVCGRCFRNKGHDLIIDGYKEKVNPDGKLRKDI